MGVAEGVEERLGQLDDERQLSRTELAGLLGAQVVLEVRQRDLVRVLEGVDPAVRVGQTQPRDLASILGVLAGQVGHGELQLHHCEVVVADSHQTQLLGCGVRLCQAAALHHRQELEEFLRSEDERISIKQLCNK